VGMNFSDSQDVKRQR